LIATILVLMAAAFLAPRWLPAPSIVENRVLAAKPAWPGRLGGLAEFRKATDAYVADHFPARAHLIGLLNRLRMLAGVSGSPRVLIGRDGWLFYDDDTHLGAARNDPSMPAPDVQTWLVTLAGRTEALRARGAAYLVVAPPVKEIIYPQYAPAWYPGPSGGRPAVSLPRLADAAKAGDVLYLRPWVADATRRGQKTYSRDDTHWTGYGAYAGYVGLMSRLHAMGLADGPRPISDFTPAQERDVRKRPRDLALMLGVASFVPIDSPILRDRRGATAIRITYLSAKHDWTAPQVIDTGAAGKPVLMMTRDSFSNELLPFLYPHFSRIILSHNQDGFWRQDLIDRFKPNIVVLEVLESGLRFAAAAGPPASADVIDRISGVVSKLPGAAAQPSLSPPDARTRAVMASAKTEAKCNVEQAILAQGPGGEAALTVGGWIADPDPTISSPNGLIRLQGPAGVFSSTIKVDQPRPDVAAAFKKANDAQSGFAGVFVIRKLPPSAYVATVLRRSADGWIGCDARQPLVVH
jgi:hypothetical protein